MFRVSSTSEKFNMLEPPMILSATLTGSACRGLVMILLYGALVCALVHAEERQPELEGRLSAAEALTIEVTPESWRSVQAKLDDVYTIPEISRLRNSAIETFVAHMAAADRVDTWESRAAARDKARHELLERMGELTELRSKMDERAAKLEAGLAIAEMMLRYGNFPAASKSAQAQLKHDDIPQSQRAQAYRIWLCAARGATDSTDAEAAQGAFQGEMPGEAESSFAPVLPFGPIRLAIQHLEYAQAQDDFALRHSSTREVAAGATKLRDKAREMAAQMLATRRHG